MKKLPIEILIEYYYAMTRRDRKAGGDSKDEVRAADRIYKLLMDLDALVKRARVVNANGFCDGETQLIMDRLCNIDREV